MAAEARLFRIIENLAPADLHQAVWAACSEKRWYFGNESNAGDTTALPFWKMDLDGVAPVEALWRHVQANCESVVGYPLRIARVYANGHTYGLGGRPHVDDPRDGTTTLLYYPMQAWRPEWEGETLWFDGGGNVIAGVLPAPNRAVLFDSRLLHAGRAPSRYCGGLRVTVAYKLEPATA